MSNDDNKLKHLEENNDLHYSIKIDKKGKENKASMKFKMFIQSLKNINNNIEVVNFKSNIVKFSYILTSRSLRFKILIITLSAFIMSLITLFFIKNSGLYSVGINGLFQGFSRLTKYGLLNNDVDQYTVDAIYNAMFWTLNILANIPLTIFAYKKVSKQFAVLTIFYVVCGQLFGLALGYIPGIDKIMVFGETNIDLSETTIGPEVINKLGNIPFIKWGQSNTLSLFVYCLISGILSGLILVFVLMVGSSTGGTDIFSVFFARKKNKSIGFTLIVINNICLFTSTFIGSFCSMIMIDQKIITNVIDNKNSISSVIQSLFSPNLIFSGVMAIISGLIVDLLFPKSKFVQVKIYTKDIESLKNNLSLLGYKHSLYINEVFDPLENNYQSIVETICMYIELPSLLSSVRTVDKNSMISINKLSDIDGPINVIK